MMTRLQGQIRNEGRDEIERKEEGEFGKALNEG